MPLRPCLDCGAPSQGSRCEAHRVAHDNQRYARRGTTTERGLGATHQGQRRHLLTTDRTGICPRCGQPYTANNPATAEHSTPRSRGGVIADGLLCRRCNSSAGARLPRT